MRTSRTEVKEISAESLMQIPSHVIGLALALQLSISQIDTQALPAPFDGQAVLGSNRMSSKRFAMEKSRESPFGGDLTPHQNDTLHFV